MEGTARFRRARNQSHQIIPFPVHLARFGHVHKLSVAAFPNKLLHVLLSQAMKVSWMGAHPESGSSMRNVRKPQTATIRCWHALEKSINMYSRRPIVTTTKLVGTAFVMRLSLVLLTTNVFGDRAHGLVFWQSRQQ